MRTLILSLTCPLVLGTNAQQVLHYTETSGFDHQTRGQSLIMFQDIAVAIGATVVDDDTGDPFNDLNTLQQYDVVVFSNTSGDGILDAQQRTNFEAYINNGGSVMGIHAASDTYRHSTANGGSTGTWDFYAELIGASVQQNPNHVSGTPQYDMQHIGQHASTALLPDPWTKNEEYYYWENGYYRPDNVAVLEVEETIGPNNMVNSYDAPRPMSWYRELPQGGRMFYTALGHAVSNFTSDMLFRQHIAQAMSWVLDLSTAIAEEPRTGLDQLDITWWNDELTIRVGSELLGSAFTLRDSAGRIVRNGVTGAPRTTVRTDALTNGAYQLVIASTTRRVMITR